MTTSTDKTLTMWVNVMRQTDENNKFQAGIVTFKSTASKQLISHLIETEQSVPNVYCSRKGDSCATPITELQQHNGHVPSWSIHHGHSEEDMKLYAKRIVDATSEAVKTVGGELVMGVNDGNE